MSEQIEISRADRGHVSEIERLWRAVACESDAEDEASAVEGFHRSLRNFDFLQSDSFWFLLARADGAPVGYLTAARVPKADGRFGVLYIDELHVLQTHRRRGIGSALLRAVDTLARGLNFWRIRLKADQDDPGVCGFYRAGGFSHSGDGFFQKEVSRE